MAPNISAERSAFHTFALTQCRAPGLQALPPRAVRGTGSCRSGLPSCRCLPLASVPPAELPCLKDAAPCWSLRSSPAPSRCAQAAAHTANLSQELQGSRQKSSNPQPGHQPSAAFCLSLLLRRLQTASGTSLRCAQHGYASLGSSQLPLWL